MGFYWTHNSPWIMPLIHTVHWQHSPEITPRFSRSLGPLRRKKYVIIRYMSPSIFRMHRGSPLTWFFDKKDFFVIVQNEIGLLNSKRNWKNILLGTIHKWSHPRWGGSTKNSKSGLFSRFNWNYKLREEVKKIGKLGWGDVIYVWSLVQTNW